MPVINNVRWGTIDTWDYCFDGIPENSIVAIGTVASNLMSYISRHVFEEGFFKMIELIKPRVIIISGSWEFVFSKPRKKGQNPVVKHAKFTGLFKNSFL